jgi:hypothetical protein
MKTDASHSGLVVRAVTLDDAEQVADLLNEVILTGKYSLLDTPFSVEAERAFIAGSRRAVSSASPGCPARVS